MRLYYRFWQAFYDRAAFVYDAVLRAGTWLHVGSEERIRKDVIGSLKLAPGARVLEVGCGTASNRLFLSVDIHYVGMDISRNMLKVARSKCGKAGLSANFVQADAAALPFSKGFADFVLAMGVLQHLRIQETAISQMHAAAQPNAQILIIDERRSQKRILGKGSEAYAPPRFIGEYFVVEVRPH